MNMYVLIALLAATTSLSLLFLWGIPQFYSRTKITMWALWVIVASAGVPLWIYAYNTLEWFQSNKEHVWVVALVGILTAFMFFTALGSDLFPPAEKKKTEKSTRSEPRTPSQ